MEFILRFPLAYRNHRGNDFSQLKAVTRLSKLGLQIKQSHLYYKQYVLIVLCGASMAGQLIIDKGACHE